MGIQALADKFDGVRGAMFAAPLAIGMALTSVLGFTGAAQAQDASAALQPVAAAQIDREAELEQLGQATRSAHSYATECFKRGDNCVGILLHIGDDLYERRDQLAKANNLPIETVEAYMVSKLEENYAAQFSPYGVQVKMFPSANPGTAGSGLAFFTNNIPYETQNGTVNLNFALADQEVPNVVKSLETLRQQASIGNDTIVLANN